MICGWKGARIEFIGSHVEGISCFLPSPQKCDGGSGGVGVGDSRLFKVLEKKFKEFERLGKVLKV